MHIHLEESITIDRPVQEVSEFVEDLRNEEKFWVGVKSVKLLSGKPGKVGAKYERVFDAMGKEVRSVVEIVEHVPHKRLVVRSEPGHHIEVHAIMTYASKAHQTTIHIRVDVNLHGLAIFFGHKIKHGIDENTRLSFERLKGILEADQVLHPKKRPASKPTPAKRKS